jgi:hypothetical protein
VALLRLTGFVLSAFSQKGENVVNISLLSQFQSDARVEINCYPISSIAHEKVTIILHEYTLIG